MRGSRESRARASSPYGARLDHALAFRNLIGASWAEREKCGTGINNAVTKTILVKGGAGYIGSHTSRILAQKVCQPIAFDNLSSGHTWAAKRGPLERGTSRSTINFEAP
jgi:hypothetical protein